MVGIIVIVAALAVAVAWIPFPLLFLSKMNKTIKIQEAANANLDIIRYHLEKNSRSGTDQIQLGSISRPGHFQFLVTICFLVFCFACNADWLSDLNRAAKNPYRRVGDKVYNLKALVDWRIKRNKHIDQAFQRLTNYDDPDSAKVTINLSVDDESRPLPNWAYMSAKVIQITEHDGLLLRPTNLEDDRTIRLKGYPGQAYLVDGDVIQFFACQTGVFSYVTTQGATSKIYSYDFGQVMTTEEYIAYVKQLRMAPISLMKNKPVSTNHVAAEVATNRTVTK